MSYHFVLLIIDANILLRGIWNLKWAVTVFVISFNIISTKPIICSILLLWSLLHFIS